MSIEKYIKNLTHISSVSGFEHDVSDYIISEFNSLFDDIHTDAMGNVIACKKSKNAGGGSVMLEAHIDEIGLIVSGIDENGFLLVAPIGGIDCRILYGNTVNVHAKNKYVGVVGAKPPHVMTEDEYSKVLGFDSLYVDVGMTKEQATELIPVGSVITFMGDALKLKNGYMSAKCMDDRASLSVILDCIKKLSDVELDYNLYVCACVQEEVGLRGSLTAAYGVNPDFAIAIDVTHATTPDESKGTFKCGCGPVVCVGPNIHPSLVERFRGVLDNKGIPYEIEVEGGNTGTDAWSIQTAREGIPTMLLSLPLKYMHTPIETLSIDDCNKTSSALCEFLKSFKRTEDALC